MTSKNKYGVLEEWEAQHYVLSDDELKEKAKRFLNEPDNIEPHIEKLRQRLTDKQNLNADTSDQNLIRFLRCKKWRQDDAYETIKQYYKVRKSCAKFFNERYSVKALTPLIESGITVLSPEYDQHGRAVMYTKPPPNGAFTYQEDIERYEWARHSSDYMDVLRFNHLVFEMLSYNPQVQVCGVHAIENAQGINMTQAFWDIGVSVASTWAKVTTKSFPMRFRGLLWYNEPAIVDYIFNAVTHLMPAKLQERSHFVGTDYDAIVKIFGAHCLPPSIGGRLPDYEHIQPMLIKQLTKFEETHLSKYKLYGYK